jgi:hypothetical protein
MNYRSVVIRGRARGVDDPGEHRDALRRISDHVVASWEHGRDPNDVEIRKTMVIALALTEASAKIRVGDPIDEVDDIDGPHWAGTVALESHWGSPTDAADLRPGIDRPPPITAAFG